MLQFVTEHGGRRTHMKKIKGLCLLLAAALLLQVGMLPGAAAADDTYEDDPQYWAEEHKGQLDSPQLYAYGVDHSWFTPRELNPGETLKKGVDVSQFQKDIDWAKAKASGIDFAFIRVGYRGYGTGSLQMDTKAYQNIENALANGVQVGVYIYSQAITEQEGREEAQYVLSRIKNYNITLPVVIDYEYAESGGRYTGRLYQANLSKAQATSICNAFCAEVAEAGYRGAVYANKSMLYGALNPKDLIGTVWLAHYTSKTDYAGNYEFWQCTSSGYVDGIPTENVDLDYWFDSGTTDALPFTDVALDRWSYQDVLKAYELGLVKGITATTFVPHGTASRGQVATMLYRMSGSPAVSGSSSFTDLNMNYYRDAIAWAEQNQVIKGMGAGRFAPNDNVTREQLVTMLYRLAGQPAASGSCSSFTDAEDVSNFAKTAMCWAVEKGLMKGSGGKLNPKANATREQVAAILIRYLSL